MTFFRNLFKIWIVCAASAVLAALCSGCAAVDRSDAPEEKIFTQNRRISEDGWHHARFKWRWPEGEEPKWHLDDMLAHRVIAPAIERFEQEIRLWRFHRRASRDSVGSQFSFIFHCSREAASRIYETLDANPLLGKMKESGLIEKTVYDDIDTDAAPRSPEIEDTSDKNWPQPVRRSWPYFIMGASRMWLEMIDQVARQQPQNTESMSLERQVDFYGRVEREVTLMWRLKGSHAFLHHLNALFGYQPLVVYEKRMMEF